MSLRLLSRGANPEAVTRVSAGPPATDDFWYNPTPWLGSDAGVLISRETAMKIGVVVACVRVKAETTGSLPLPVYRRLLPKGKERATNHPLYELLHDSPNEYQTSQEFRELLQGHIELRGTGYAEIIPGPRGPVDQLMPLHPDRLTIEITRERRIRYKYREEDGRERQLLDDEVFRVPGWSTNGITGFSTIEAGANTFGLAYAAESYAARFFAGDSQPRGLLTTDNDMDTAQARRNKRNWQRAQGGLGSAHQTAVLSGGLKWQAIGVSAKDAQLIEERKFSIAEIARWFRIPSHMVNDLERATFNNIEELGIEFVVYSELPTLTRWEGRIRKQLIMAPQTYFAEFLVDGLLRGKLLDRWQAYQIAVNNRMMNPNEARDKENMNPYDGGEEFFGPLNTPPVGQQAMAQGRLTAIAKEAAGSIVRREIEAVSRMERRYSDDTDGFEAALREFYEGHGSFVASKLHVDSLWAGRYAERQREIAAEGGSAKLEETMSLACAALTEFALWDTDSFEVREYGENGATGRTQNPGT